MKYLLSFFLFIVVFDTNLFSQENRHKYYRESKITEEVMKEDIKEGGLDQAYSYIGLYQKSNEQNDIYPDTNLFTYANGKAFKAINYATTFFNIAKQKKIVILNEAHNYPQSRFFLYTILDSLKKIGYKDIFLETFAEDDSFFQTHKIPTVNTGAYTREIVYGETIRKISLLNFHIHEYEKDYTLILDTQKIDGKFFVISKNRDNWKPIEIDSFILMYFLKDKADRNILQAFNIYHRIRQNNIQKSFIYCGYGHGYKRSHNMGNILLHLMKESPYFIDQVIVREHSQPKYEHPFYSVIRDKTSNYSIITNMDNTPLPILSFDKNKDTIIDMLLATPVARYIHNRPTWLELNKEKKRTLLTNYVKKSELGKDCLVIVYDENEYSLLRNDAIPVDIFQYFSDKGLYDLILRPQKKYRIIIVRNGKDMLNKIINTKTK